MLKIIINENEFTSFEETNTKLHEIKNEELWIKVLKDDKDLCTTKLKVTTNNLKQLLVEDIEEDIYKCNISLKRLKNKEYDVHKEIKELSEYIKECEACKNTIANIY